MTGQPNIERRIFIVGTPRSGTTLLQSLLAAHSRIASFTESHLFRKHFSHLPLWPDPILTTDPYPHLIAFLAENGEEPTPTVRWFESRRRRILAVRPLLPLQTRAVARRLLAVLDEVAHRRNVSNWIEKTPWHLRHISLLEKTSPRDRTYFIHVIRRGSEVVASLFKASKNWERPYDLASCVRRWNEDVARSLGRVGYPNHHFVLYERLTAAPETVLSDLVARLGLAWEPEVLERFSAAADEIVSSHETWKQNVGRPISPSKTSHIEFDDAQRLRVDALLDSELYDQLVERITRGTPAERVPAPSPGRPS
jgi:hypothetical protein